MTSSSEMLEDDGMGINASIELQYLMDSGIILFADFGFLSLPTSGNSSYGYEVTYPPIFYLMGGIAF